MKTTKRMTMTEFLLAMGDRAEDWGIDVTDQAVVVYEDGAVVLIDKLGIAHELTDRVPKVMARVRKAFGGEP